jgi:hypothetical protein
MGAGLKKSIGLLFLEQTTPILEINSFLRKQKGLQAKSAGLGAGLFFILSQLST